MSQDRLMNWRTKRLLLRAAKADDVIGTSGADTGQNGGGPVVAVASGASGFGVVQIAAQNDEVEWLIPIPYDMDPTKKVLGRVVFIHASTDADTPIWTTKIKFIAKQASIVDTDTNEDQAVAFAAHTCSTTDDSLEITAWTDLNWDDSWVDGDAFVAVNLACTNLGSASANEIELYALELMYEVKKMHDRGRRKTTDMELQEQNI